mmetsp:Transcript_126691/g.404963  ORF Transcript_126691/g.404963 Transcript_126691/m.404963 type:complete len:314 (+) Transcript_126691:165-1106(+)
MWGKRATPCCCALLAYCRRLVSNSSAHNTPPASRSKRHCPSCQQLSHPWATSTHSVVANSRSIVDADAAARRPSSRPAAGGGGRPAPAEALAPSCGWRRRALPSSRSLPLLPATLLPSPTSSMLTSPSSLASRRRSSGACCATAEAASKNCCQWSDDGPRCNDFLSNSGRPCLACHTASRNLAPNAALPSKALMIPGNPHASEAYRFTAKSPRKAGASLSCQTSGASSKKRRPPSLNLPNLRRAKTKAMPVVHVVSSKIVICVPTSLSCMYPSPNRNSSSTTQTKGRAMAKKAIVQMILRYPLRRGKRQVKDK